MKKPSRQVLARICVFVLMPTVLPGVAFAQAKPDKAKSKNEQNGHSQDQGKGDVTVDFMIDFNAKDARRWAAENKLVGQKPLPPGIRKNLARGKPLPPGIAKRGLPTPFVKQLPAHAGYEWQMSGTDLLLISTADMVVREIVKDVFK